MLHAPGFDLKKSVQSGQAFRWKEEGDGLWLGICRSHPVLLRQEGELLYGTADLPEAEAGPFWQNYLGIDRDYTPMEKLLEEDPCTAPCLPYSRGIRIFRQEAYETLISFILSANNNVRRISKTIESICKRFGDPVELCGRQFFSFPGATVLSSLSPQQLTDCGAGYRAPYVVQSARRIAEGYDLERLRSLDFDAVKKELLSFSGVGPKVAECIMLFSLDCERAFPVDVWVNRIVQYLYPGEEGRKAARAAAERFGCWAGAAQQYLFHYARCVGLGKPKKPSVKPTKTASTEKTKISISSTGGIGT